ncbi:MAG: IS21 family transposase [Pseudonocardiaceae bacterium]
MSSRVELFELIRRDRRLDPLVSARVLAKRYRVSARTVGVALAYAVPPARQPPTGSKRSPLAPAMGWVDEMLRADLVAPRKQRHTIRRIFNRLADEHGFTDASYTCVRYYVNRRRPQLLAEARDARVIADGMVPQLHEPGAEAEVDFAEVWIRLDGVARKCYLFTLRLSYSGKAVHRVFGTQSQEAFLQGHVEAFTVLGGVPTRHIRYDNLSPAVNQVCFGRTRIETQRWTTFRSHYSFDPFYCMPGIGGAHEKGGVESEGGRFRRNHLVPVPDVVSLAALNEHLSAVDAAEDARQITGAAMNVGAAFALEAPLLRALPDDDFDCGITLTPTVSRTSRVTVRQCFYSVPARFIGRKIRVSLRADEVIVYDGRRVVACHPRLYQRGDYRDDLDHYLEILLAKPGALQGSTALAQARTDGVFTDAHQQFWTVAKHAHGDAAGTRALIEVLLLHRHQSPAAVIAGITAALDAGSTSPDLVAIEARKTAPTSVGPGVVDAELDALLADAVAAGHPSPPAGADRPAPSVDIYDQLLTLPRKEKP